MSVLGGRRLPDYLTVEETAHVLGYHPAYVRRMLRHGKLDADKKGGMWLIHRAALESYQERIEGKAKNDPTRGN